jgi:hypothetical protein
LSAKDEKRIADLEWLVESLQSQLEALQQSSVEPSPEAPTEEPGE